jgi:4-amino-4-deoxy-L-arabinose transferase-like glycosyltransferase
MSRREKLLLFCLLLGLAALRCYHLNTPPWEIEESWRQADTESIAWNYVNYDFNPFHPNLNYDGPLPNIPALEIQVTTYLIAIFYKIAGHEYLIARLVPLSFFILSGFFLYRFSRIFMEPGAAYLSLLIYGILPINVYYSRAIMPESGALMFWTGGFYFFNRWILAKRNEGKAAAFLFFSSVFLALAIMTKPPVVLIGLPMLYLCYQNFQWRWLKFRELWGYALATLALPAAYYYWSASIAEFKFTVGITRTLILEKALTAFYSPEAYQFYAANIPRTIGLIGVLSAICGIFFISRKQTVILVWFGAMLIEVLFFVSPIRATYYLIFITVPCSLVIGNFLYRIRTSPTGRVIAVVLVLTIALQSYYQVKSMFTLNTVMQNQVKAVQSITRPGDLLVVGSLDPCLLSLSDRRGWRYNLRLYPDTPADPQVELAGYIAKGAKYFVPIQGKIYGDENGRLMKKITARYPKLEPVPGYPIYQLQ